MSSPRPDFMDFGDPLPGSQVAHDVDMNDEVEFTTLIEGPEMDIDHAEVDEPMEVIAVGVASREAHNEISMTSTILEGLAPVEESQMDTSVSLECPRVTRTAGYSGRRKRTVENAFESAERTVKSRLMDNMYGDVEYTYPREDSIPTEPEGCPRPHPSHAQSGIHSCSQRRGQYVAYIGTGTASNCRACTYKDGKWCKLGMDRLCLHGKVRQPPFRIMHEGKRVLDNADAPVPRPAPLDEDSNPLIAKRGASVPIFDVSRIATFSTLVKLTTGDVNMDTPATPTKFDPYLPQPYNLLAKFEEKDLYPDLLQPVDKKEIAAKREVKAARVIKAKKNGAVKEKIGLRVSKKDISGKKKNGFFNIYNKVVERVPAAVQGVEEFPISGSPFVAPVPIFTSRSFESPIPHVNIERAEIAIPFSLPSPPTTPPPQPFPNRVAKVIIDRRITPEEILAMAAERQKQAELRALTRAARRAAAMNIVQTSHNPITITHGVNEVELEKDEEDSHNLQHQDPVIPGAYPIEENNVFSNWDPRFYGMPLWQYVYSFITGS